MEEKRRKSDVVEGSGNGFYCSGREIDDSKGEEAEKSELGFLAESPNSADVIPKSPVSEEMGGGSKHELSQTSSPEVKANGVQLKVLNETKLVCISINLPVCFYCSGIIVFLVSKFCS